MADSYGDGQANAVKTAIDLDQGIKSYGTFPLQGFACGPNVQVLLAVVEPKAADYLTAHYAQLLAVRGGHLQISGWLQTLAA